MFHLRALWCWNFINSAKQMIWTMLWHLSGPTELSRSWSNATCILFGPWTRAYETWLELKLWLHKCKQYDLLPYSCRTNDSDFLVWATLVYLSCKGLSWIWRKNNFWVSHQQWELTDPLRGSIFHSSASLEQLSFGILKKLQPHGHEEKGHLLD